MPEKRRATAFLFLLVTGIFLLFVALILLMTRPARAAEPIPCQQARALLIYAGGAAEAERIARRRGYTAAQIAEVRKRCGI